MRQKYRLRSELKTCSSQLQAVFWSNFRSHPALFSIFQQSYIENSSEGNRTKTQALHWILQISLLLSRPKKLRKAVEKIINSQIKEPTLVEPSTVVFLTRPTTMLRALLMNKTHYRLKQKTSWLAQLKIIHSQLSSGNLPRHSIRSIVAQF